MLGVFQFTKKDIHVQSITASWGIKRPIHRLITRPENTHARPLKMLHLHLQILYTHTRDTPVNK